MSKKKKKEYIVKNVYKSNTEEELVKNMIDIIVKWINS